MGCSPSGPVWRSMGSLGPTKAGSPWKEACVNGVIAMCVWEAARAPGQALAPVASPDGS